MYTCMHAFMYALACMCVCVCVCMQVCIHAAISLTSTISPRCRVSDGGARPRAATDTSAARRLDSARRVCRRRFLARAAGEAMDVRRSALCIAMQGALGSLGTYLHMLASSLSPLPLP